MRIFKIEIKKIKNLFGKFGLLLIEKGLFTLMLIFFFSLILGIIIFFKYTHLSTTSAPGKEKIKFEESLYKKVLEKWQENEKKFKEADFKEYPNLFK